MKLPWMISAITWVQWLLGLSSAVLVVYLLALTRSRETLNAKDPAGEIQGLEIGAAVLVLPAVAYLVSAYAMQKGRRWGWWLALVMNIVSAAVFLYGVFDADTQQVDKDVIPFAAGFVVVVAWLLWPRVRKFFWSGQATAA